ncbi:unnamed protein product [Periconia digitata]|uniref:Uncharacterized protein n=1 Tax=Periconia digitata TaxID=1303443 RepID=A0A9W4URS2_9PLEO|nr:unnamed protein product [Periconia digitata]
MKDSETRGRRANRGILQVGWFKNVMVSMGGLISLGVQRCKHIVVFKGGLVLFGTSKASFTENKTTLYITPYCAMRHEFHLHMYACS